MSFRPWMLLLCLSLPAVAQQVPIGQPLPDTAPPAHNPTDRRIKLDVVVTDKSGKVIPGLNQQDFTVLDNKQPKQLLSFQAESQPTLTPDAATEVVVVIDQVQYEFFEDRLHPG